MNTNQHHARTWTLAGMCGGSSVPSTWRQEWINSQQSRVPLPPLACPPQPPPPAPLLLLRGSVSASASCLLEGAGRLPWGERDPEPGWGAATLRVCGQHSCFGGGRFRCPPPPGGGLCWSGAGPQGLRKPLGLWKPPGSCLGGPGPGQRPYRGGGGAGGSRDRRQGVSRSAHFGGHRDLYLLICCGCGGRRLDVGSQLPGQGLSQGPSSGRAAS